MVLHLEVRGTGKYLPASIVTNEHFTRETVYPYDASGSRGEGKILTAEGIYQTTGIRERRKAAPNESSADLGYNAAVDAIENAGIKASSLAGIVVSTVTQSQNFPSAAVRIQEKLGIRNGGMIAFDIANACAGFPLALRIADSLVGRNPGNYLVVAPECLTQFIDPTDINATLFGDGAGAAVLSPTEDPLGIIACYSESDPLDGKADYIFRDGEDKVRMPEGRRVLREAIEAMVRSTATLKERIGWTAADVYIPHQANGRILDGVAKRIESGVVYRTIERYGNMSAATCAVALDEALRDGTIQRSTDRSKPTASKVIVTSFGAGLVTAATAIQF